MDIKAFKENYKEYLTKFNHKFTDRVRFEDVDSFQIVHNLRYLFWLEKARTEYLRAIGLELTPDIFLKKFPIVVAHVDLDYFSSARFDNIYNVHTRISFIKNSSFQFENIITLENGELLLRATNTSVNTDLRTGKSVPIFDEVRNKIIEFEGDNIQVLFPI
jgi:acyl-CoA thioester hydrolase